MLFKKIILLENRISPRFFANNQNRENPGIRSPGICFFDAAQIRKSHAAEFSNKNLSIKGSVSRQVRPMLLYIIQKLSL